MENNKLKQILIRYAVCVAIATAIVFGVLAINNVFSQTELSQIYKILCDAFFVSGILFILFGALFFLSDEGAFDGIGWALKSALRAIFPFVGTKEAETYKSYRDRKHSKGKTKGYSCIFFTGLVYLAISIVFMILFNNL